MLRLPSEIQTELAERAKKLRKQLKISQKEIAERSGVSYGSLKRFERTGQISLESLLKVAVVLNSLDDFDSLFSPKNELPASLDDIINP